MLTSFGAASSSSSRRAAPRAAHKPAKPEPSTRTALIALSPPPYHSYRSSSRPGRARRSWLTAPPPMLEGRLFAEAPRASRLTAVVGPRYAPVTHAQSIGLDASSATPRGNNAHRPVHTAGLCGSKPESGSAKMLLHNASGPVQVRWRMSFCSLHDWVTAWILQQGRTPKGSIQF